MSKLEELMLDKNRIALAGHVRPDGDCVGSTTGCAKYIKANYPEKEVVIFLEKPSPELAYLFEGLDVKHTAEGTEEFDLFICMDCEKTRLGFSEAVFDKAKATVNVDHHISNKGCADVNIIQPTVSSTGEVLYELLDPEKITKDAAESIYVSIIHDTGVFQYTNTSTRTMEIAGHLISFGFDFSSIIEETFYQRTFLQTKVMAYVLNGSSLHLDGAFIFGSITAKEMEELGATNGDFEGIVNQLRNVAGVEAAAFIYEKEDSFWKVSLRTRDTVDASKICESHGGGGHKKASGCMIKGEKDQVMEALRNDVKAYL